MVSQSDFIMTEGLRLHHLCLWQNISRGYEGWGLKLESENKSYVSMSLTKTNQASTAVQSDCLEKPLQPTSTARFQAVHPLCWPSRMREWCFTGLHTCASSIHSSQGTVSFRRTTCFIVLDQSMMSGWRFVFWNLPIEVNCHLPVVCHIEGLCNPNLLACLLPWPEDPDEARTFDLECFFTSYLPPIPRPASCTYIYNIFSYLIFYLSFLICRACHLCFFICYEPIYVGRKS